MLKKVNVLTVLILFLLNLLNAQYDFAPSQEHPFGLPNPDAPKEILDYAPLIGECECKSVSRNPDRTWADTVLMTWRWKYILNGWAVQDETLKSDNTQSGSIRQYSVDSSRWYVHYYTTRGTPTPTLSAWEGNKDENGDIVLYRDQPAPNGMAGWYKIVFSDITDKGFNWTGAWVNKGETFVFPNWKISCIKKKDQNNDLEKEEILAKIKAFSNAYMGADYETIANAYTVDGKIFPGGTKIIEGREAIQKRWTITNGSKVLHHEIEPVEITFLGDYAYDYGYYRGKTQKKDETIVEWEGKYVIVWKKEAGEWKMYLDIWNRT